MREDTIFTELLITKIFHDLAGSVTAISNGVEFIEESEGVDFTKKAVHLISSSTAELVHKVNLYRFMYGKTAAEGEMDFQDIIKLMNEFFDRSKISVTWPKYSSENTVINLTSLSSRLLVNLIYLAATTLIAGGQIEVKLQKTDHGKCIEVVASGQRLKVFDCILRIVKEKRTVGITLENVQVHLVSQLASALAVEVNLEHTDHTLTFAVDIL